MICGLAIRIVWGDEVPVPSSVQTTSVDDKVMAGRTLPATEPMCFFHRILRQCVDLKRRAQFVSKKSGLSV
jgi:hypothetical protein